MQLSYNDDWSITKATKIGHQMKEKIGLIIIVFVCGMIWMLVHSVAGAEELNYKSNLTAMKYNQLMKVNHNYNLRVNYNTTNKTIIMYTGQSIVTSGVVLNMTQVDELIASIDKYFEWRLKATEKGVMLNKVIKSVNIDKCFWKYGNADWNIGNPNTIEVFFSSLNLFNHQLYFEFPKFESSKRYSLNHKVDAIFLSFKQATALREALTTKSIDKFLREWAKQQVISNEFN